MPRTPLASIEDHPTASRRYAIVVGADFAAVVLGAGALIAMGQERFVPVWIFAVAGVHFIPLVAVLRAPLTRWLGAGLTTVAAADRFVGIAPWLNPAAGRLR